MTSNSNVAASEAEQIRFHSERLDAACCDTLRSNAALFGGYSAGDHGESLLCDNGLLVDEAWGGIKPTSQPPVFGVTEDFWQPHWNTLVLLKEQKVRKATFQLPITGHACWHR